MYESFFQLKQRPFAAAPRVDRYFPGTAIEASRLALARCIERAEGAGLLVGPAGTGKTLLCHLLAEQFRGQFAVATLSNGHLDTRRELLQAILFELGLPYRRLEEGELRLSLIDYVSNEEHARNGLLLLLDEAHTLSPRLLEEVRLIANLVRQGQPRVRLVLAGNPTLEECLADPSLAAFSQRIATRCYLESLDYAQTQQFVLAQMTALGADARHVFSPDALEAIYRATDGIPRLINQVCDHALMLAFAGGRRQIDQAGVEEAWADLQQLPVPWNEAARSGARSASAGEGFIEFGNLDDGNVYDGVLEDGNAYEGILYDGPPAIHERAPLDPQHFAPAGQLGPAAEATLLMHQIDDHLGELQRDFASAPAPCIYEAPKRGSIDPFHERFDEEEVLVDRYTSIEPAAFDERQHVRSDEGRLLSALLEPFARNSAPDLTVIGAKSPLEPAPPPAPVAVDHKLLHSTTVDSLAAAPVSTWEMLTAVDTTSIEGAEGNAFNDDWEEAPAVPLVRRGEEPISSDDDVMIVEDDPRPELRPHSPRAPQVRRQEYRQLFSSLRRG